MSIKTDDAKVGYVMRKFTKSEGHSKVVADIATHKNGETSIHALFQKEMVKMVDQHKAKLDSYKDLVDKNNASYKIAIKDRVTISLTKKNQATVNRFVRQNCMHDFLVNELDHANEWGKPVSRIERLMSQAYEFAQMAWLELPKSERKNLIKTHTYLAMGDY